jgi:hypothetical protein
MIVNTVSGVALPGTVLMPFEIASLVRNTILLHSPNED